MAKKRLKRGVDWHGWIWKDAEDDEFMLGVRRFKPPYELTEKGKWVRVKFVEVER